MKIAFAVAVALAACNQSSAPAGSTSAAHDETPSGTERASAPASGRAEAVFAGGCFWCMETAFEDVEGVESVTSGYAGGPERSPTYEQVSSGRTGHYEAVRVVYDPARVTYAELLDIFWHNIDPTQDDGQFCDRGAQYRSAIFAANAEERRVAEESKSRAARTLDARIVTEILDASPFWVAEDYHQDFYRTHPVRYTTYRHGCGRDRRLREVWGDTAPAH